MNNKHLARAKEEKNDEYFTSFKAVKRLFEELLQADSLKGKSIYCPCDTEKSAFVFYLETYKERLGVKEVYYSSLKEDGLSVLSDQFKKEAARADFIITNPPFSIIGKFYKVLKDIKKDFVLVAPLNFIHYKEPFEDITKRKLFYYSRFSQSFYNTPVASPCLLVSNKDIFTKYQKESKKKQEHIEQLTAPSGELIPELFDLPCFLNVSPPIFVAPTTVVDKFNDTRNSRYKIIAKTGRLKRYGGAAVYERFILIDTQQAATLKKLSKLIRRARDFSK